MTQDIQPVKRPRGRPRKNPLPAITESDSEVAVIDDDVDVDGTAAPIEEDQEFNFVPTGNEIKDRALKGAINDAPELFKYGFGKKRYVIPDADWNVIRDSANPAGACELYAVSKFVKEADKVLPTLLAVKKLLVSNRDGVTVLKAYKVGKSCKLKELINRVNGNDEMVETDTNPNTVAVEVAVVPIAEVVAPVDVTPVSETPVETTDAVVAPVTYVKGQIVKNPADASQTWTIGNRGRKPQWFLDLNVTVVESDEPIIVESTKVDNDEVLVCPDDKSKTYTIGQRGRVPEWAQFILDARYQALKDKLTGKVLTDPNDKSNTYTIGQRGRIPAFAVEQLQALGL